MEIQLPLKLGHSSPQSSAHVLSPNGTWCHLVRWYRLRLRPHCVRWGPNSSPKGHNRPQYSAHVCCGQTAGWIMRLGLKVDLDPGDIVLDGEPTPRKGSWQSSPCLLSAHVYCVQTVAHLSYCRAHAFSSSCWTPSVVHQTVYPQKKTT